MTATPWIEFLTASDLVDPTTLEVSRIHGREAISHPYEYRIELTVNADGGLSPDAINDLLVKPALLRLSQDPELDVHGIVRDVRMLTTTAPQPIPYVLRLVPKIWLLSNGSRSRIFQEMDVPTIISTMLEELDLAVDDDFEMRLNTTYPESEYVVQYQESDLDFLHRLMEHQGIHYYFEQTPDRERIIFGDDNRAFEQLEGHETIAYGGREDGGDLVFALEHAVTPQPVGVLLREYNWRTPNVGLQSEAPADQITGRGVYNRYGEHFKDPSDGTRIASVRAEELLAQRDVVTGESTVAGLSPGHTFDLSGHPLGDLDRPYLVTEIETELARSVEGSTVGETRKFTAIPTSTVFRPARRTARPKIEGIMHARVDGEVPGTAAPIDEYGRYRILFPFDLAGEPGGRATRWVRLAQPASGPGYGIHFPLHIGVEVAVAHLDGDPDRPIIMNSPPNAETVTPVNNANPTQSEIVTKTGIRMTWDDDC